jgi:KRAB domain-containing zinc finger protein
MQQHLRICVNSGRKLKLTVQRLTDEQLLACQDPEPSEKHQTKVRHECQLCGENLKSAEFLKTHVDSHSTPIPGEIKCSFDNKCTLIFTSSAILKEHRQEHYQALQISCEVCGKRFRLKCYLRLHMLRHAKTRLFSCDAPGCSYMGKTIHSLRSHMTSKHCFVVCTCHLCGKKLKSEFFKHHMMRHNADTPGVLKCLYQGCKKLFQNGDDLRKHTDELHLVDKKFQCDVCGKCYASKGKVREHMRWHSDLRPFKCDVTGCIYSGQTKSALRNHVRNMHNCKYSTCCYCGREYKNDFLYARHLQKHLTDTPGVFKCLHTGCKQTFTEVEELRKHVNQKDSHDIVKQFACGVCGQINSSKTLLENHMLLHQVGKIACPIPGCNFFSNSLTQMHSHRITVHVVRFEKTCQLCGQGCYAAPQYEQHMEEHKTKAEGIAKCLFKDCQEIFPDLKPHMKQHGYIHECDVPDCLFASSSESDLQLHKITMHSIWPHNCQLCGRGFDRLSNLVSHLKCHETGELGVVRCLKNNCNMTFTAEADLRKHVEIHRKPSPAVKDSWVLTLQSLEDPHSKVNECSLCGKIVNTRVARQKHTLKHATETPGVVKCILKGCQLTFTSAANLKEHSVKHWDMSKSEERSLACDFPGCNKAFKNVTTLHGHKRTMHSSSAWTCHLCGKKFKNASYGGRHMKAVHKDQPLPENPSPIVQVLVVADEPQVCKDEIDEVVFD